MTDVADERSVCIASVSSMRQSRGASLCAKCGVLEAITASFESTRSPAYGTDPTTPPRIASRRNRPPARTVVRPPGYGVKRKRLRKCASRA
ncbi:hypothetical protein [Lysobacter gummosus]|uniref:hypothetical protein n=1 Tax=Lysobacter gummosus TaxID=262324 RepID=UPI003645E5A8